MQSENKMEGKITVLKGSPKVLPLILKSLSQKFPNKVLIIDSSDNFEDENTLCVVRPMNFYDTRGFFSGLALSTNSVLIISSLDSLFVDCEKEFLPYLIYSLLTKIRKLANRHNLTVILGHTSKLLSSEELRAQVDNYYEV
jgi:hypothetical protein